MGRFGTLKEQKQAAATAAQPVAVPAPRPVSRSKRDNPGYLQFSAYMPKEKYLAFKSYIVGQEIELSDAVEEAVDNWMKERAGK